MEARVVNKRSWRGRGVYVGRPTLFGNPFRLDNESEREAVLQRFRDWFMAPEQAQLRALATEKLRGQTLICWCAPKACHADVLMEWANREL